MRYLKDSESLGNDSGVEYVESQKFRRGQGSGRDLESGKGQESDNDPESGRSNGIGKGKGRGGRGRMVMEEEVGGVVEEGDIVGVGEEEVEAQVRDVAGGNRMGRVVEMG